MRSINGKDDLRRVTPKRLNEIQSVLVKASMVIDDHGWIQWHSQSEHGYCAYGAINYASQGGYASWWAKRYLEDVIGGSIPDWNDNPKRTKKQVLAAFDKAIKLVKKEMK